MRKTITEHEFVNEFDECDRGGDFSRDGRRALFEYLEQLEENIGEDIELDIIALCCEYSEYEDMENYIKDYYGREETKPLGVDKEDYDSLEEWHDAVFEELRQHTTVILIGDEHSEGFIIQCF